MNSFPAQYPGTCDACGQRIEPGQQIHDPGPGHSCAHAVCPVDPDTTADRAALKAGRCARCGLNHPGEC